MRSDGAIYIKSAAAVEKAAAEDASPVKDWYRESGATISPLKVTYAVQRKRVAADELPLLRASDPEVEAILTPMRVRSVLIAYWWLNI